MVFPKRMVRMEDMAHTGTVFVKRRLRARENGHESRMGIAMASCASLTRSAF